MAAHYSERHPVPTVQEYREIERARQEAAQANQSQLPATIDDEQAPSPQQQQKNTTTDTSGLRHRRPTATATASPDDAASDESATVADIDEVPRDDEFEEASGGAAEKARLKAAAQAPTSGKEARPTRQFHAKGTRKVHDPVTGGDVVIRDGAPPGGKKFKIEPEKLDSRFPGGFSTNVLLSNMGVRVGEPKTNSSSKAAGNKDEQQPLTPEQLKQPGSKYSQSFPAPHPAEPSNVLLYPFPPPLAPTALSELTRTFHMLALALACAVLLLWTVFVLLSFRQLSWSSLLFRTTLLASVGFAGWTALHVCARRAVKDMEAVRAYMHQARGEAYSPPMPESVEWLNAAIAVIWKQLDPQLFAAVADQVEDVMQQSLPGFIDAVKVDDIGIGTNAFRLVAMRGLSDFMTDKEYPREEWITQGKSLEERGVASKNGGGNGNGDSKDDKDGGVLDSDGDGIADEDESGDFLNYEISFSYSARPGSARSDNIHLMLCFWAGMYDLLRIPLPVWVQIEHLSGTVRLRAQIISEAPYVRNVTFSLMGVPRVEVSVVPMVKALPNVLDLPLVSGFVQSSIAAAANEYVAPKSMTLNVGEMLAGGAVKKDTDAIGVIAVQILHAEDLSSQDANGKSDPYIIVSLAKFGRPLYSTRIIFEDLNPVWNEHCFVLVTKDDVKADEKLSLQLWDSDKRTADDIIGRISTDVKRLMQKPNQWIERTDGLMGFEDADTMQGSLTYRVGFFDKAEFNKALAKKEEQEKDKQAQEQAQAQGQTQVPTQAQTQVIDALNCPPDPQWPSGILSVVVEHIEGLENREVERGYMGKAREGTAGQDVDNEEGNKKLPNSYCELILNDDIIYRSRVKMASNMPFFNCGTEVFVRDWREARVAVCVRDARLREHDPIMGIVALPLKDLFNESSQVSRRFSLSDGVAFGKVALSFVFRSVKLEMPRPLLGSETATVEMLSKITLKPSSPEHESMLANKKIIVSTGDATQKIDSKRQEEGDVVRLPVYDRFSSALSFDIGTSASFGPIGGKPDAIAAFWLCDIEDNTERDLEIPILTGPNLGTLKRNYINDFTAKHHKFEQIGTLHVRIKVDPGLDLDHEKLAVGQTDRHEYEVFNRLEGMPKRAELNAHAADDGVIDKSEQKEIDKAKREALHARHRGSYGYSVVRSSVWAKDGLKQRVRNVSLKLRGKKDRDQTVATEA